MCVGFYERGMGDLLKKAAPELGLGRGGGLCHGSPDSGEGEAWQAEAE